MPTCHLFIQKKIIAQKLNINVLTKASNIKVMMIVIT